MSTNGNPSGIQAEALGGAVGGIGGYLGKLLSEAAAIAAGTATAAALAPILREIVNETFKLYPDWPLSPAEAANARQQGFIDAGRQKDEASMSGTNSDRAEIQFELAGLPPGVETGMEMLRRGFINEDRFRQIVREGHTKTKYTDELLALKDRVLTASIYVRLYLKGWISEAEMNAGGAHEGFTPEEMHKWYLAEGRPAAPGQMATAIARGAPGPDGGVMDEAQFLKGIRQSDIRPEWGPMLYAIRHAYPPLFQISRLVDAKEITPAEAVDWAKKDRYAPEVVAALEKFWTKGGAKAADTHVSKAQNQLWTSTHASFLAGESNEATAAGHLDAAGVDAASQAQVLALWAAERELRRSTLTPANIKKGYAKAAINAATGGKWTRDEAVAALVSRGYSVDDANSYLNLP